MDGLLIFTASYLFIAPLCVLGVYYFWNYAWPEKKRAAFFAVPAGIFTYCAGFIANHLYTDPRPFVIGHFTPLVAHIADNGFPSDHTLLVAALASVGMYWNRWLGAALWALAVLVAVGRVGVGLHHPLDVIGSMAIALVVVSAWRLVADRLYARFFLGGQE